MQSVLALDISASPAEILVARVDGTQVEIRERIEIDLEIFRDGATLLQPELAALIVRSEKEEHSEANTSDDTDSENGEDAQESYLLDRVRDTTNRLSSAIRSISSPWMQCVVTIPPLRNVSLNLELPFGDQKNLQRIVDLEVQDVIPFDIDDFLVQYSSLGPSKQPGTFDIHVGLIPRIYIRNLLQLLKVVDLEPMIVTVPSSAVAASFHVAKDYFTTNSAIILARDDEYSIAAWIDGEVRAEHVIRVSEVIPPPHQGDAQDQAARQATAIFTALKLMIASIERRYNTRIETVHVVGKSPKLSLMQQILGRPVQNLTIGELIKGAEGTAGIAALPAVFADEDPVAVPLSNFRAREFSFNPTFGEFIRIFQASWKHLAVAAVVTLGAIALTFGVRKYSISRMESYLLEQVRQVVPAFNPADGDTLKALSQAEAKLSDELGVLGSPSKITPLDVLIEIHKRLPQLPGLTITSLKISSARATITGFAPDLSAIERVEKELRTNQSAFAKVTANPGSSAGSRYNFTVEIILSKDR